MPAWRHTAEELYQKFREAKQASVALRWQALWKCRLGGKPADVARELGVSAYSVRQWLHWYGEAGESALEERHRGWRKGRPRGIRLSPELQAGLRAQVKAGQIRTVKDAVRWAAERGVQYSEGGMKKLMYRLGFSWQVARPRSEKADAAAQAAWKKIWAIRGRKADGEGGDSACG